MNYSCERKNKNGERPNEHIINTNVAFEVTLPSASDLRLKTSSFSHLLKLRNGFVHHFLLNVLALMPEFSLLVVN